MVVVLLTRLRTHPQNLNSAVKHSLYTLIAVSRAVSLYIAKIASSVHKREIPADPGKTKQGQNWFQVPGNSWHSAANGPTTTLNTDATPPHPSVTMQYFFSLSLFSRFPDQAHLPSTMVARHLNLPKMQSLSL